MTAQLLGTVLMGGVAGADASALAQLLISQPLVTATLLGLLWHDVPLALSAGSVLQMMAAGALPLGARTPEDYSAGGVVGASVTLVLAQGHPFTSSRDAAVLLGVLAGMLASMGGVPLARWQRRRNEGLARWAEQELLSGARGVLLQASWAGVALAFGLGVSYCALCLALGVWLGSHWVAVESLRLANAWLLAQPLWMGFGVAQLLYAFIRRRPRRALLFAAALTAGWVVNVLELG